MMQGSTRREWLAGSGASAAALLLAVHAAEATPESLHAAIRNVAGNAEIGRGKIKLDIPPLVENGNTVPMSVSVESPMTATDYVKTIYVFNEKNPQPNVVAIHLGPYAGKADVSVRIRLANSQRVVAIAELNDGSFWSTTANVIVTVAACIEGNL
jgi:sulfur-oxidizing protein SoxY